MTAIIPAVRGIGMSRRLLPGILCGVLASACAIGLLAASAYLITLAGARTPIGELMGLIVGVRAFALGRAALRYLERLTSHDAAFRMLAELRTRMFARLVPLAPDGLRRLGRGDLLARLVSDVDELQNLPLRVVLPLATSLTVAATSVVVVWLILPAAGVALAIALLIALALGTVVTQRIAGSDDRALSGLRGEHTDAVVDLVTSLDVLTAYGALEERRRRIDELDDRVRRASVRRSLAAGVVAGLVTLLAGLSTVMSLYLGAGLVASGTLAGPWYAVLALVPIAVFEAFAAVPLAWSSWRSVRASAERIDRIVPDVRPVEIPADDAGGEGLADAPSSAPDASGDVSGAAVGVGPTAPASPVGLSLRGITAGWPGASTPALRGVDLDLAPGECVLLTGESGAGKTTLAHVLVRFLDFEGAYTLAGRDVASMSPATVRRFVGLCEQAPHIFDNTIRNNLAFARESVSDEELSRMLERVGLAGFVAERGGLDARVGESGALISGGQAQRIALARALLADFPILVLDEPTANVDPARAEALLTDMLAAAEGSGRGVLLISHAEVPERFVTRRIRMSAGALE